MLAAGTARYAGAIPSSAARMQPIDTSAITRRLIELREEHRDLDAAIARMIEAATADDLQLRRMKKRKLLLKDMIARLESRLIPDLDA
jgi:hypothetical protein